MSLATGEHIRVYEQGVRAGSAEPVEVPWAGRTRREKPVPWFVVNEQVVVQAYASQLVALDRLTGKRLWSRSIDGASWFSPIVSDEVVIAAEAVYPGKRQRNNGSDYVRAVAAFDVKTGKPVWRSTDVHPERKLVDTKNGPFVSRASFKTMSARDGLLLLHVSSYQFKAGGSVTVLDLRTGRLHWRRSFDPKQLYTQGSQRPVIRGGEVALLDGTGVYRLDARTGEPIGEPVKRPRGLRRTGRTNGACTASRATVNWFMANAWLYVGPDGKGLIQQGARAACGQGVVPAHGLAFVTPTPCDCGDYMRGYIAMAPDVPGRVIDDKDRLTRGVDATPPESFEAQWPTLLGNAQRTASSQSKLARTLKAKWTANAVEHRSDALDSDRRHSERHLGALSAPVVGGGLVVVAAPESHGVIALDEETGEVRWSYRAGGKIDSPPTLARGLAVFGCDDGAVYALRLKDGKLVWRFVAAPTDGLAMLHGHLSSSFPVPGSVTILGNAVIAVAGQHTDLGGLHVWSLDLTTGRPLARRVLDMDAPPAIANNITVADADGAGVWVVSPPGGSYGAGGAYRLSADLKDLPIEANGVRPAVVFDRQGTRVRFRTASGRGGSTHGWKGAMRANAFHRLRGHRVAVADHAGFGLIDPGPRARTVLWSIRSKEKDAPAAWALDAGALSDVESLGAMVCAGDTLLVAGGKRDGSTGDLFVIDAATGRVRQHIDLPARVTECGIAVADGRVVVSCEDGSVHVFE